MRIAVDAMGGDFGPEVTVQGAIKASQEHQVDVLLVGAENLIKEELKESDQSGTKTLPCGYCERNPII